jgi:hypothetical protein
MNKPFIIAALAVLACACGQDEPPPSQKAPPQGRAETQAIRNTEAVGVSGNAIADKVDNAIVQTEEADKKLKEEADRQSAEQ